MRTRLCSARWTGNTGLQNGAWWSCVKVQNCATDSVKRSRFSELGAVWSETKCFTSVSCFFICFARQGPNLLAADLRFPLSSSPSREW